jgi:hypothetical protein
MATFYERACKFGSYGSALDLDAMEIALRCYADEQATTATVAAQCTIGPPSALTAAQLVELDTLLATRPVNNLLTPVDAFSDATWAARVMNTLRAGRALLPGFSSEALIKEKLGV